MRSRTAGFTLIELMITVTIVAILAAIALPSYRQHVIRGHRSAAQAAMMDLANREQQYLLANRSFADKVALTANGYALPAEVAEQYDWNVAAPATAGEPTFEIVLTPRAGGGQVADGELRLDHRGTRRPADKW